MGTETAPKVLSEPEIARTLEGMGKHLEFVKTTMEAGWNARDERGRAFHLMASLKTLENVMTEQQILIEQLYRQNKQLGRKPA